MLQKAALNEIQANILRRLRMLPSGEHLRFAEINTDDISSDQFSYHLRQLQRGGLIVKHPDGAYSLSTVGKSEAPLIAPHDTNIAHQGYVATRITLTREVNGELQFLLQERSVNPQHGMWSVPGGKIPYGMLTDEAARHYMQRQTGLRCDVALRGMTHYVDEYRDSVVQDRYFFIFMATNPQGELLEEGPRGKNIWRSYAEIQSSDRALPDLLAMIDMVQCGSLGFKEGQFTLDDF